MAKNDKKIALIARGSSHISYFRKFAEASSLNITVIKINSHVFKPSFYRFLRIAERADIDALLTPHLSKKSRKHPSLHRSFLWAIYKQFSRLLIKLEIAKSAGLIERHDADIVGVWNGQKQPSSSIAEAAKALGKEVIYFENGLLPNSTTCDWSGVNCKNSLPRDGEFYRQFNSDKPLPCTLVPRAPIAKKNKGLRADALPEHYVFVPFQVETDSQIISNSPWIRSMGQLYQHLANVIDKVSDPQLHIVVKEHPSEPKRHDNLHKLHSRIVFANQCETQHLIERSQAVLTVNSTVGIESLLLGKPVMTMGEACYGIRGVCALIDSEEALLEKLNRLDEYPGDPEVKNGFLHFLNEHYVIPNAWNKINDAHVDALTKRLTHQDLLAKSLSARL